MNEVVSIIIPAYNIEKYVAETIECVLNQTYQNWEMEITDDCSTDNTVNVIEKYVSQDTRIHLWRLDKNSGAAAARNNSIKHARGRYIAFLDGDDWWYPAKLEKQIQFMEENGYEFTFTDFEYADATLKTTGISHKPKYLSYRKLLLGNNIGTPGVIYDTKNIGKLYMHNLKFSEDWMLWIDIAKRTGRAYALNCPLWKYRTLSNSLSRNKLENVKQNIRVYRNVLGYSKIAAYLIFFFGFMPLHIYKLLYTKLDSYLYLHKNNISAI